MLVAKANNGPQAKDQTMHDYTDWHTANTECVVQDCHNPRAQNLDAYGNKIAGRPPVICTEHKKLGVTAPPASIWTPRPMVSKYEETRCFVCGTKDISKGERIWYCGNKTDGGNGAAHGWHSREQLTNPNNYQAPPANETYSKPYVPFKKTTPQPQPQPQALSDADKELMAKELLAMVLEQSATALSAEISDKVQTAIDELRPKEITVHLPGHEPKKVEGKTHKQFESLLRKVAKRRHIWITGPAGTGKSYVAEQIAEALDLPFSAISVGAQTSMSELKGYMTPDGTYVASELFKRYTEGGVYLVDEADAGHPGVLTALNGMLAGRQAAFPNGMHKRHDDFICLAAANTFGNGADAQYVARNVQDKAFLNRFVFVDFELDEEIETHAALAEIEDQVLGMAWIRAVRQARQNVTEHGLKVLVTPRASINGCACLDGGDTWSETIESTLLAGIGSDQRAKVLEGVDTPKGQQ